MSNQADMQWTEPHLSAVKPRLRPALLYQSRRKAQTNLVRRLEQQRWASKSELNTVAHEDTSPAIGSLPGWYRASFQMRRCQASWEEQAALKLKSISS
ncbi:hypothetical protein LDENG_00168150 [Lucifuga dentata]|nr:hypothetical protein LDENG_00168150 [Lucifuga dentata]